MPPHVSVVIPMYNAAAWIEPTLHSVLAQTVPADRLETIIIDDCSKDGSVALARDFLARHDMQGVVLESARNSGVGVARNRGWMAATGEWIQFLDADDLLAADKIELQSRLIEGADADVAVICSPWQRLGAQDGEWKPYGPVVRPMFDDSVILKIVSHAGFLGPALIRRSWLDKVSGFSEDVRYAEDEHMMLKIAAAGGRFIEVPGSAPLFFVRQTPGSKSRSSTLNVARQHLKNVVIAEHLLRERDGGISAEDSKMIASLCDWTLSQLYEHDRPEFRRYLHWLRDIDPHFVPEHSAKLKLATHVVGYENAEGMALVYRRMKAWYSRLAKPLTLVGR